MSRSWRSEGYIRKDERDLKIREKESEIERYFHDKIALFIQLLSTAFVVVVQLF